MALHLKSISQSLALITMAILSFLTANAAGAFEMKCFGPTTNNKLQLIYLHGIYTGKDAPIDYLTELDKLADKLGIRIAVPRSDVLCKKSKDRYCWGTEDEASVKAIYDNVIASAGSCIDTKKPFELLGFSNGGYFVTRVGLRCIAPQPRHIIAFGNSGDADIIGNHHAKNCPSMQLWIGNKDITANSARRFAKTATARGVQIDFNEFPGRHELPLTKLQDLLLQRLTH